MNTDLNSSRNTYFGLLDKASIFEVLLRLHYVDLINLLKVRSYLTSMTATKYFCVKWKSYNVRKVRTKKRSPNERRICEKDRLRQRHGTLRVYQNNNLNLWLVSDMASVRVITTTV